MHGNVCALSLFLTRGPYAWLLAGAGEKKSGVFNFAEQTRRGGLSPAAWSVSIFVFFTPPSPPLTLFPALLVPCFDYTAKHTRAVTQETGSPIRLSLPVSLFVVLALIRPDCTVIDLRDPADPGVGFRRAVL